MRYVNLIGICLGLLGMSAAVLAGQFIPSETGAEYHRTGRIQVGDESRDISDTLTVLAPHTDSVSGETWIVNRADITIDSEKQSRIKYYAIRKHGVYCVATRESADSELEMLDKPYVVIPLPPVVGAKWSAKISEDKKKVELDYEIVALSDSVKISDREYSAVKIHASGSSKVFGMKIPIDREIWMTPDQGMIRSVTRQTIMGQETVTTIELTVLPDTGTAKSSESGATAAPADK